MKLGLVVYLLKEGCDPSEAIDTAKAGEPIELSIEENPSTLYIAKHITEPKWASLFANFDNIPKNTFHSKSVKAALLFQSGTRHLIYTFGHGRALINLQNIERGFGLRVALNLGDPQQIKSIDKSILDKVALKTRSQTSKKTSVSDFDFEFDHEILKSLSAIIQNEDNELETISGLDAANIYTVVEISDIPRISERLLNAYTSDEYKNNYPWVDFIQPVTDPKTIELLNSEIARKLNSQLFNEIWISPPEIVDYNNFSGFSYKGSKLGTPCLHPDIDLEIYIKETKLSLPTTIEALKRRKITIYDSSEVEVGGWSIYHCLNGEAIINDDHFILNDGNWYRVEKNFAHEVNKFFEEIPDSNLVFPPYLGQTEGEYLRRIADGENLALLDQQWVYPHGTGNRIEFCDLLSQCNSIIHVKQYGSSSVLSHLFSQARVSIDLLLNDPTIVDQVKKYLDETYLSFNFKTNDLPRKYKVVLAIMQKRPGKLHIPFFSKVNIRHHVRHILNVGFNVEKAKIEIGP